MIISFLISRSVIKWHRPTHFNQETSWYHAVSPLVGFNPYFTKLQDLWQRFPLWVRNTNFPSWCLLFFWFWDFCERCVFSPRCFISCAAADIISTVEFNSSGELLATGDKGGRVVVFQREQEVGNANNATLNMLLLKTCCCFFWHFYLNWINFLLMQHYTLHFLLKNMIFSNNTI